MATNATGGRLYFRDADARSGRTRSTAVGLSLVYLFLWNETHGKKQRTAQLALVDIAEGVGLSKRGVQDALGHLGRRKLIAVERQSITAVPVYTVLRPWRR